MAPEQAELNNLDIDTRADIYALGVILYELLTGHACRSPARSCRRPAFAEMLRIIQEVEPPKPSTKLSGSADAAEHRGRRGRLEPQKLTRLVRGDLDWIVMKCLEKDRGRRYETANGLALDIQRYLADEPVLAGPPSAGYRLRKFVSGNRPQVLAAGLVLLALVGGVVGTTLGMFEAQTAGADRGAARWSRQRGSRAGGERTAGQGARSRAAQAGRGQREGQANEEKQIAQAVRDFLQNKLLGQADRTSRRTPAAGGGAVVGRRANPTIRELLDRAAAELSPEKIEENFPGQPLLQAEILNTVGDTYRGVGEYTAGRQRSCSARPLCTGSNSGPTTPTRSPH